jgi:glycosyltransferase involved in cell wall biosynthesis
LDLINFENEDYFPTSSAWRRYRRCTQEALALADAVVCPSRYIADRLINQQLAEASRVHVVPLGVDHIEATHLTPPAGSKRLINAEYMLCLGADYQHKNRLFALKVLAALQERHQWNGFLVFAGPHAPYGSSAASEAEFISSHPAVGAAVVRFPNLTGPERNWLYHSAALVIYPTSSEGFGFIPFEAAQHNVPSLFAPTTSLAELFPASVARLSSPNADDAADQALHLIRDSAMRASQISMIRRVARSYTWEKAADQLIALYRELAALPPAGHETPRAGRTRRLDRGIIGTAFEAAVSWGTPRPDEVHGTRIWMKWLLVRTTVRTLVAIRACIRRTSSPGQRR